MAGGMPMMPKGAMAPMMPPAKKPKGKQKSAKTKQTAPAAKPDFAAMRNSLKGMK